MTTLTTDGPTDNKAQKDNNILEVSFVDIILFARKYFKVVLLAAFFGCILGVALSFMLTKRYESRIVLLPEYGSGKRNSLAFLAAGLTSDGAEKLMPELYPTILQSSPFGAFILKQPVTDQKNQHYKSLNDFLNRNRKADSPGLLSRIFSGSKPKVVPAPVRLTYTGVLSYSPEEQANIGLALSLFDSSVDAKNGVIEINAETEDPFVSAIIVEMAKRYLIQYVEDYRTTKEATNVKMLQDRVREAKTRLRSAEVSLQSYRDRNRNTFSNVARLEEQRLQSEYLLSQSLYDDLTQRFEQAKINVKDEKPVFKVLEPAKVPLTKSSPKRLKVGMILAILCATAALMYILFIKEKIMERILG